MSSGRCLFLLFFATLLAISLQKPIAKSGDESEPTEKAKGETLKLRDPPKLADKEKKTVKEENDDEDILTVASSDDNGKTMDYDADASKEGPDPLWNNVFTNDDLFDSKIFDRRNPIDVTAKTKRPNYKCHDKIPFVVKAPLVCHIEYHLASYTDYALFIKTNQTYIPRMWGAVDRIVPATKNPCFALLKPTNGKLTISCGCRTSRKCKTVPAFAADIARLLQIGYGGQIVMERDTKEKAADFWEDYKVYLITGFVGFLILCALIAIAFVEWKGSKWVHKRKKARIAKLSQRIEQSRSSLRTTCSEPSEPSQMEDAFSQLMRK